MYDNAMAAQVYTLYDSSALLLANDTEFVHCQLQKETFFTYDDIRNTDKTLHYLDLKESCKSCHSDLIRYDDLLSFKLAKTSFNQKDYLAYLEKRCDYLKKWQEALKEFKELKTKLSSLYSWFLIDPSFAIVLQDMKEPLLCHGYSAWWGVPHNDPRYIHSVLNAIASNCV